MKLSTTGDIQSPSYLTTPANAPAIRRFLRATGLGHTKTISYNENPTTPPCDDSPNGDTPKPEFGSFEP